MAPGRCLTVRQNPLVNRSTNRNNVDINSGIDTQMLNQLIATRVAKALAAAAVTHAASTQVNSLKQKSLLLFKGMDKSKITRKQSRTSKHGHENQKSTKPKPRMSSPSQSPIQSPLSTHNKPQGPVLQ
ncbi:hypothetical protein Tco_0940654 [Tanacetum coccineum]|uniref:Uncharacterized protein n=1 Tax=Tanacetum coccineum TaxID=301880 RepID=A0ABQ5DP40_9ASTR